MSDKQFRSYNTNADLQIETRGEGEKKTQTLKGYCAVFNSRSEILGWYREILMPGCFAGPLREKQDVRALLNHDPNFVLGRTTNDTLRLRQDDHGLISEIDLPDTQAARDLAVSIGRADINQMSFAFSTRDYEWDYSDGEYTRVVRTVKRLFDASPVTYPAYQATSIGLRAMEFGISLDMRALIPAIMRLEEGAPATKEDPETIRSAISGLEKLLDKILVTGERTKSEEEGTLEEVGKRLAELQGDVMTGDALLKRLQEIRG